MAQKLNKKNETNNEAFTKKLHISCQEGNLPVVESMIQMNPNLLDSISESGNTLLMSAIKAKQVNVSQFLINAGADLNAINNVSIHLLMEIGKTNSPSNRLLEIIKNNCILTSFKRH